MLNGVLTGTMPVPPEEIGDGVLAGRATYHAVLTPKGKMVTDLWAMLPESEETSGYVLDVPVAGREGLVEHLGRFLPPRFAVINDASEQLAMITVVGPGAAEALTRLALGLRVEASRLEGAEEGRWWRVGSFDSALTVAKAADVWPDAYSVLGSTESVVALWKRLVDDNVSPAGLGVWSTLRVEAARPVFGTDMDGGTIPVEAGIHDRAIDHRKGCYTGQEVIVRIRDRGHVNRHLRQLELGDVPTPARGAELFAAGDDSGKVIGSVTSAVQSPKHGGALALAYVRRGIDRVTLDGREIAVPTE